jgi:hypothetical protein
MSNVPSVYELGKAGLKSEESRLEASGAIDL